MISIALVNREFQDLNPLILGWEDCVPGHCFGPAVRQYTLIHFIKRGCGRVYKNEKCYCVAEGQAFIILPGEIVTYCADEADPWEYYWIGFNGALSKRFFDLPPVIDAPKNWAKEMLELCLAEGTMQEHRITAILFSMYADLFSSQKHPNHHIRRVKNYIRSMYMEPLCVEQIARMVNLDRRYLSRLFKSQTGKSVQEYLISVRIEEAKKCLERGCTVEQTAQLCGYGDPCNFSKMFKRLCGVSPGGWKKK